MLDVRTDSEVLDAESAERRPKRNVKRFGWLEGFELE
jgi:hypothetical protein